jgi:hypothetical protein
MMIGAFAAEPNAGSTACISLPTNLSAPQTSFSQVFFQSFNKKFFTILFLILFLIWRSSASLTTSSISLLALKSEKPMRYRARKKKLEDMVLVFLLEVRLQLVIMHAHL